MVLQWVDHCIHNLMSPNVNRTVKHGKDEVILDVLNTWYIEIPPQSLVHRADVETLECDTEFISVHWGNPAQSSTEIIIAWLL